jgi:molybdopterin-guanine dinucleotide biosynthesis protein A
MLELSCIVLAGGRSVRMGIDKRELELGGKSFFDMAIEKAHTISEDVIVSLGEENQVKENYGDLTVVIDEEKERGPLFALATSLKRCKEDYTAVLPVDAPLLNPGIYGIMTEEIEKEPYLEAVVPRSPEGSQPIYGTYRVSSFLTAIKETISAGGDSVVEAISALKNVKFIDLEVFRTVDPKLLSFHNVNTPYEMEVLEEVFHEREKP